MIADSEKTQVVFLANNQTETNRLPCNASYVDKEAGFNELIYRENP